MTAAPSLPVVEYKVENLDGFELFYREAGPIDAPVVLLLHGFPTSSHMFRNLIPYLAEHFTSLPLIFPATVRAPLPTGPSSPTPSTTRPRSCRSC